MSRKKVKYSLSNWDLVSVNPNYKVWNWKDLFCFWAVSVQSVIAFSLIASLYILYNLNTFVVFFGTLIGSLLVYFLANLIGKPSQKYGLPFAVFLRSSLGFRGAKYFGFLRGLVGIFMFGVQTYFLSKAFTYLIRICLFSIDNTILENNIFLIFVLGLNVIDWASIVTAILLQSFLFSVGINFNKKIINYSAIIVYSGIIFFFFVVLLNDVKSTSKAFIEVFNYKNLFDKNNIWPLITISGTVFAYFSILLVNFGDFSRNVQNENELKKGNLSLIINLIIFSFFSVFIVIGSDVLLNLKFLDLKSILTSPNDIIGKFDNLTVTIIALLFIIVSSISTNLVSNFVPSQYSLINFIPSKLNLKSSSMIIGILGFIISIFWFSVLSQIGILSFVDTLSSFFGPLFGLMIADYYLIKNEELSNKDIYSLDGEGLYFYSGGWHLKGIYSLFLGFVFASSTIWNSNLMFLQPYAWIIGAIVSYITYYLLTKK
jgi:NCS1 family nucleobase:cation symporter-1